MTKAGVSRVILHPHVISGVDVEYVVLETRKGVTTASLSRSEGSRRKEPIPLCIPGIRCSSMNISIDVTSANSDLQRDLFCI